MLRNLRLEKILELVNSKSYASLHELMEITSSSESTIRADLVYLEKEGKILRLRGGAKTIQKSKTLVELNMNEKYKLNTLEKIKIAKFASALIDDSLLVYIDAGTTTAYLCDYINQKNVVFVTNSMTIANKLKIKGYRVYVTGGEIKLSTDAFIGSFAQEIINKFTFDIGFFGCNGVSLKQGFTTPDYEEANIKQMALSRCKKAYLLVDSSKFNVESGVMFASIDKAEIITDKLIDNSYLLNNVIEVK